jgi:hypothetical protein
MARIIGRGWQSPKVLSARKAVLFAEKEALAAAGCRVWARI